MNRLDADVQWTSACCGLDGGNTIIYIKSFHLLVCQAISKLTSLSEYSNDGNTLASTTDTAGNKTEYGYDPDTNVLLWVKYPKDSITIDKSTNEVTDYGTSTHYEYDDMFRLESSAVKTDQNQTLSATYTYENDLLKTLATKSTTYTFTYGAFSLIGSIKAGSHTLASYSYTSRNNYLHTLAYGNEDSVEYTYDKLGRVTEQTWEDEDTVTYQYNNDGALAAVTDSATGITTRYFYDFAGRIAATEQQKNGATILRTSLSFDSYGRYQKRNWTVGDTSYYEQYTYGADGMRHTKTVGDVLYTYYYEGSQLQRMTIGDDVVMDFFYDQNGQPYAMKYNNTMLYYVLNQQGDVVKLVTNGGTSYGVYHYDAWGNILYSTDNQWLNNNPLRYRGYVYDTETTLYYLQSRYYDPELGRFINADSAYYTNQGILGSNMYAYCLNSPSNLYDPDGRCSRFLGFLWKVDCNSPTCSTSKSYIKPSPPVESIGTYNDSNGNPIGKVYIIQGSQLEDMNRSKEATDVVIIDKRTESKPAMQVQNSYAISNKEYQRQICQLMVNYNTNNPVDPAWYRTVDSMLIEWKAHNDGYKARVLIGLFKDNAAERLMHVDFDNDAEGTPYWGFLGK